MALTHSAETAKKSYNFLLYALTKEKRVRIGIQKIAGSHLYVVACTKNEFPKFKREWDINDKLLMRRLKGVQAIDPKNGQPKDKYEGSPLIFYARGHDKNKIVVHPSYGSDTGKIAKALKSFFKVTIGKNGPGVVDGNGFEENIWGDLTDEAPVADNGEEIELRKDETDAVESALEDPAVQDPIGRKLREKIEQGIHPDPASLEEMTLEELQQADDALSVRRQQRGAQKEKEGQAEAEEAERNRAGILSPEFRTNVAADVSRIVTQQFQVNRLTGAENVATLAEMTRMITAGLEEMALATSDEAERKRMTQSRLLGLQLALSFSENMRMVQRIAKDSRQKRGDPWLKLNPAERTKLESLIGHHEIRDQHDLVQHLFELARREAFRLKRRPAGADGDFWAPYDSNNALPDKFYFFTGAFEAAKDGEKLKLLERYILMVQRLETHPERLVDMLSLDGKGTELGWDFERDWPPESWWAKNRWMVLHPEVALPNKALAAVMSWITPDPEQASKFREDLQKQDDPQAQDKAHIFHRVHKTIQMRKETTASSAPADADGTSAPAEMSEYRSPLDAVTYNVDKLSDALDALEQSEDAHSMATDDVQLADLVGAMKAEGFDKLLGDIDRADSEEALAGRVEEARQKALAFREQAAGLDTNESELSEEQRQLLKNTVTGLDGMLDILSEIDRRRILIPAVLALASGYSEAQKAYLADGAIRKPPARCGQAMLPFFSGEYELLLERVLTVKPAEREETIDDAKTALATAMPKLEQALSAPTNDVESTDLDTLRDKILDALRPALATALSGVEELERLEAARSRS